MLVKEIFTSQAGPMDQLTGSRIMMLDSSRALWRHTMKGPTGPGKPKNREVTYGPNTLTLKIIGTPSRSRSCSAALTSNSRAVSDVSKSTRFGETGNDKESPSFFSGDAIRELQRILLQSSYGFDPPQPTQTWENLQSSMLRLQLFFWNL